MACRFVIDFIRGCHHACPDEHTERPYQYVALHLSVRPSVARRRGRRAFHHRGGDDLDPCRDYGFQGHRGFVPGGLFRSGLRHASRSMGRHGASGAGRTLAYGYAIAMPFVYLDGMARCHSFTCSAPGRNPVHGRRYHIRHIAAQRARENNGRDAAFGGCVPGAIGRPQGFGGSNPPWSTCGPVA